MIFRKISILFIGLLLTGCATQTTLTEAQYVADDWFVVGQDQKKKLFIHAKNMGTIQKIINIPDGSFKSVIVKKNDTLAGISKEMYGSTDFVKLLAFYNEINDINLLIEGEEIIIPSDNSKEHVINPLRWRVRFVNRSDVPLCVDVQIISKDYIVNIEKVWYILETNSTLYVGDLVQNHWVLEDSVVLLEDSKWKVGNITTTEVLENNECVVN